MKNQITMSGIIIDEAGEPIKGALIGFKGNSNKSTSSDLNGKFEIEIPESSFEIIVSAHGMKTTKYDVVPFLKIKMYAETNSLMKVSISQDEMGTHLDWKHDGITPKMIDWFWSNMGKGYILWHPSQHEKLEWAIPPVDGNPVGSVHIAPQTWNDGVRQNLYIRFENLENIPDRVKKYIKYKHVVVAGIGLSEQALTSPQIMGYRIHQWEATNSGVIGCSSGIGILKKGSKEDGLIWAAHCREEIGNRGVFLPTLYHLYKVVTNPVTNPFADLSGTGKGENAYYKYIKS